MSAPASLASSDDALHALVPLARAVATVGERVGLPYVALSADISSPGTLMGPDGRLLAETVFRWFGDDVEYWRDRRYALRAPFVMAARRCAEPFYYQDGVFRTWRPAPALESIDARAMGDGLGMAAAIMAPTYLPGGVIGVVAWANPEPVMDLPTVFEANAAEMQAAALKLNAAYREATSGALPPPARLTRREIQCLKWAAAGKTDAEVATIMAIATPTVRFHLKNAAEKLRSTGRSQTIHRAVALGYVADRS